VRLELQAALLELAPHLLHERFQRAALDRGAELLEAQDRFVITAKGIDALMFEGTSQNGFIKITVPALRQRQTIEQIWLAGGEVVAVNPIRRTLEELFVDLANQNGGGHSNHEDSRGPR